MILKTAEHTNESFKSRLGSISKGKNFQIEMTKFETVFRTEIGTR
jgi:hypothetical protein